MEGFVAFVLGDRARLGAWCGIALLLLVACATPYDPFRVPESELRQRVHTIALAPFRVAPDVGDRDLLAPRVEALVLEQLAGSGFRILPAATMEAIWARIGADVGPLYDPNTGSLDPERWAVTLDLVWSELVADHGVDAMLEIDIEVLDLELVRRKVTYCVAEREAYWPVEGFGITDTATLVLGACLRARLYDREGRMIYGLRHALETYATYLKQTRAVKPLAERFTDPALLREAVEHSVGPLAGKRVGG